MFLATTALDDFWETESEILFLGRWCLLYARRQQWQSLRYQVLPDPWSDRSVFYTAADYLAQCQQRILPILGDYLNSVHDLGYGTRSWQLLMGYWLGRYLHAFYDRYILLKQALAADPDLETILLDPACFQTPKDTADFIDLYLGDRYNLQLFSQILIGLGYQFPMQSLPLRSSPELRDFQPLGSTVAAPDVGGQPYLLVGDLGCSQSMKQQLIQRLGSQARAFESFTLDLPPHLPIWTPPRQGFAALPATDEFERLFLQSLAQNFPRLYLEGLAPARSQVLKHYGTLPAVMISVTNWYSDEAFKFLAAAAADRGCRLISGDHGGGWGFMRLSSFDWYDRQFADTLIACGWADPAAPGYLNLPSLFTSGLLSLTAPPPRSESDGQILFAATSHSRYLYRFHSCPVGSQMEGYLDRQQQFLAALPESVRSHLLWRSYPVEHGHAVSQRIADHFPEVQLDDASTYPFRQRLNCCRILVVDHPSSTYLEALAANIPSVMFWDRNRWEAPLAAEPEFAELRRVGILWDSPQAAAAHLTKIASDPWVWWGQPSVQSVRQAFVQRFARVDRNWLEPWSQGLRQQLIQVCEQRRLAQPKDGQLLSALGEAYCRQGDLQRALWFQGQVWIKQLRSSFQPH
ncbi:hypothetical protein DO97_10810 [Neosynechococcus sphagnicola sy1]|uniref:Transferase n=1 Tax=Neosynechococcus sphagnicola sy1 TaxID=1497020 RepID=A0A098TI89_9CYAN|nr:LIC12162 family protein [Neosynechococcus sphagnicola]KGF72290.1 hypothetical protein DO97_10810 [Neosynechococcus sphagnicola sy1]